MPPFTTSQRLASLSANDEVQLAPGGRIPNDRRTIDWLSVQISAPIAAHPCAPLRNPWAVRIAAKQTPPLLLNVHGATKFTPTDLMAFPPTYAVTVWVAAMVVPIVVVARPAASVT